MNAITGMGEYLPEDYDEILRISIDKENFYDTWEDWKKNKERAKKQMEAGGLKVIDIIVRPEELVKYCRKNGLEINGQSRSQFISYMTKLTAEN